MSIRGNCLATLCLALALCAAPYAAAQGRGGELAGGDEKKPGEKILLDPEAGSWNLTKLDKHYKGGIELLADDQYQDAYEFFKSKKKELTKAGGKEVREPKKKLQFLANLAKELVGVQKLAARPSEKSLARAIKATNKYRETFALFKFLALEDGIRGMLGQSLETFDYGPQMYVPDESPLDPFVSFTPRLQAALPFSVSTDLKIVPQGRQCYYWNDTPDRRQVSTNFPLGEMSWKPYRRLSFMARLAKPQAATLQVFVTTNQAGQNRYEMGCGTWKGWKTFSIDFRKDASVSRPNAHAKMSWEKLYFLGFHTRGGLSDFYIDDIRLIK
ncbi:MAG: hypothetical protein AAF581_02075 [Planctomycetota bacterium]